MFEFARRGLAALVTVAVLGVPVAYPKAAAEPTTGASATVVFVVRHAEKDTVGTDPGLTPLGRQRAEALAVLLEPAGLAAVYSTPFARTRATAEPAAARAGLPVRTLEIDAGDVEGHARETARRVLDEHPGAAVLVVGHSNTVPLLLAALGVADPPALADADYGDLFAVVRPAEGPARMIRLRFGPPR